MNGFDLFLQRAKEIGKCLVCLAAVVALGFICYAAWRTLSVIDSTDTALRQTNALISTVNGIAAASKPKISATLDSVKGAADKADEAMENTRAATGSFKIASDQAQKFYASQLQVFNSPSFRTIGEGMIGVRNFGRLMIHANDLAQKLEDQTQPRIDKLIDEHTKAVQTFEQVAGRPSIGEIFDNGARLSASFVKTTEIANERLPRLFEEATKITFHAGGIAESVDIIGKGIAAPKSKKRKVADFFLESLIKSSPALLRR
jgi:hypothetical protein